MSPNMKAFLAMISHSEGTDRYPNNGYNTIVGGEQFDSYADHPRKLVDLPRLGIKSTAAGRYQVLARYFDAYKTQLGLPDFSPESQDKIAMQQIKERKAVMFIEQGGIEQAIGLCRNIWASLPGAGYGQLESRLIDLLAHYKNSGGELA